MAGSCESLRQWQDQIENSLIINFTGQKKKKKKKWGFTKYIWDTEDTSFTKSTRNISSCSKLESQIIDLTGLSMVTYIHVLFKISRPATDC